MKSTLYENTVLDDTIEQEELVIRRDHEIYLDELMRKKSQNEHSAVSQTAFDAANDAFRSFLNREFSDEDELINKMKSNPMEQLIREGLAIKASPHNTFLEEIEEDSTTIMKVHLDYAVGSIYMIRSRCQVD